MPRPAIANAGGALPAGAMLGRYELLGLLSVGGMAEIYLARTAGLAGFEKLLVVKRMLPHLAQQDHFVEMFLAEARLGAMLDHPNVVSVSDIGEDTGNYYYAMEYVRGPDLRKIVRAAAEVQGRLPIHCAVAIGIGMCAGLDHAHDLTDHQGHALGVVHRDVSLSNVLVSYDGTVKVTDFGVAKVATCEHRTRAGTLKGKIGYMSPEQCRGEVVDRRSDLFAVGIVLYELTTGRRLFRTRQSEFEVLHRIAKEDVEPPSVREPDYPLPLEEIVMRALRRDRDGRYQTAREMQRDLETMAQVSRLATTAFDLGEYVRAMVPPRPPVIEPTVRTTTTTRTAAAPQDDDPWGADDQSPPRTTGRAVVALAAAPVPRLRPRPWGRLGLAGIAMLLIGVGAAVVTRERPAREAAVRTAVVSTIVPTTEPKTEQLHDPVPPTTVRVEPATLASPSEATSVEAAPPPKPVPTRAVAAAPRRVRGRSERRADHRAAPARAVAATAEAARDAGPSLFDDPPLPAAPADEPGLDAGPAAPPVVVPKPVTPERPKPAVVKPKPKAPASTKTSPGSLDAQPSLTGVDVDGPLGDSEIRRAVKRVMPALRACYKIAARAAGKTPSARTRIRFSIDETRAARDVQASGSTLPGLDACIEAAASKIKTRIAPDVGDARVTVGITFTPTEP